MTSLSKQAILDLVLATTFTKASDYPEAYESENKQDRIVVRFDSYFTDNFEVTMGKKTFAFSTELDNKKIINHLRKEK